MNNCKVLELICSTFLIFIYMDSGKHIFNIFHTKYKKYTMYAKYASMQRTCTEYSKS